MLTEEFDRRAAGAGRYFLAATIAPPLPLNRGTEHAKMGPKIEELDDTLPDLEEDTSTADSPTVRPNVRRAPMEDLRNNLSSRSPPDRRSPLHPPPDPPRQDSKDDAGLGDDLSGMDMSQLEEMMVRVHRNPSPNPPYRTLHRALIQPPPEPRKKISLTSFLPTISICDPTEGH